MAINPKTLVDISQDPALVGVSGTSSSSSTNTKTAVINYTDPAPGATPQLQIVNDPGGSGGQIQFNQNKANGSSFGGSPNLIWDGGNSTLRTLNLQTAGLVVTNTMSIMTGALKIRGGTATYVLSTDGKGNLSWVPPAGYSNANVANYLPIYNGDISGNNINITGNIAALNIGNISALNIDGTSSNILYGNGTFAPVQFGNVTVTGTVESIAPGSPETSISISPSGNEGWAYLQLPVDSVADAQPVRLHNDAGNVEIGVGDLSTGTTVHLWNFDNTGQLNIPADAQSSNLGRIQCANGSATLMSYGSSPSHSGPELSWTNSDSPTEDYLNPAIVRNNIRLQETGFSIGLNETGNPALPQPSWQFLSDGTTVLAEGTDPNLLVTRKNIKGAVEQIYGDPYAAITFDTTSGVIWTASSSDVVGAKMTLRVQSEVSHSIQMMDILVAKETDNANVSYSVSNRLSTNDSEADTVITVNLDDSDRLTVSAACQSGYNAVYTYSVTEFNRTI